MSNAAAMRRCLIECDVNAARQFWHHLAPKAPAPNDDHEALATIHYARTLCRTINLRLRAYSHHWLVERSLPSGLPDTMRARADRLYPHIADAVGVASKAAFPEVADAVQAAMSDAVAECYAEGRRNPAVVKPLMLQRRAAVKKVLYGILSDKATEDLLLRAQRMR